MNLYGIYLLSLIALIQDQKANQAQYADVDTDQMIGPDTVTDYAVDENGNAIFATTLDAFPAFNPYAQRSEAIKLTEKDGTQFFVVTAQDKPDFTMSDKGFMLDARFIAEMLPDAGSHFGTSALVDTFPTLGIVYVTTATGKLVNKFELKGRNFKAFVAGHGMISVEDNGRIGLLTVDKFLERVERNEEILKGDEGMKLEPGMKLVRAKLHGSIPSMGVKQDGKILRFDDQGMQIDDLGITGLGENVVSFPTVDSKGQQKPDAYVQITQTSDESGTVERIEARG